MLEQARMAANPRPLELHHAVLRGCGKRRIFDPASGRDGLLFDDALYCAALELGASIYAASAGRHAMHVVAELSFSSIDELCQRIVMLYGVQKREKLGGTAPLFDTSEYGPPGRGAQDLLRFAHDVRGIYQRGRPVTLAHSDEEFAHERSGSRAPLSLTASQRWLSLGRVFAALDALSESERAPYERCMPYVCAWERRRIINSEPAHRLRPEIWRPLSLASALVAFHAVRTQGRELDAIAARLELSPVELRKSVEHFVLWYPEVFQRPLSPVQCERLAAWWEAS